MNILEFSKKSVLRIFAKQNDTGRVEEFQLVDDGLPIDLTGCTVTLNMKKPVIVFANCTITDAEEGKISVALTNSMLSKVGRFEADISIFTDAGLISSANFILEVEASQRDEEAIEASDFFSALQKALSLVGSAGSVSGGLTVAQLTALNGMFKIASYTEEPTSAYNTFKEAFGIIGEEEPDTPTETKYSITRNLTGCTSSSDVTSVAEGGSVSETLTPSDGYTLDGATVTVTMGGEDISSSYSDGALSIENVKGDIVITVIAVEEVAPVVLTGTQIEDFPSSWAATDSWTYPSYGTELDNAYGGNDTSHLFNKKYFTGEVWVRYLRRGGATSGSDVLMYTSEVADLINNPTEGTATALEADEIINQFNVDGNNGYVIVNQDGTYEVTADGYDYQETNTDDGYIILKKFTIPEGQYGTLCIKGILGTGSTSYKYKNGWMTVFNSDPSDSITVTEVSE